MAASILDMMLRFVLWRNPSVESLFGTHGCLEVRFMQRRLRQLATMLVVFLVLGTGATTAAHACEDRETISQILPVASAQLVTATEFVVAVDSNHCANGNGHCCMSPSECARICVGAALPPGIAVGLQRAPSTDFDPTAHSSGAGQTPAPDGDPPRASYRS